MVLGLLVFGAVFAVNSALHSYLILAFSKSERVSQDVGFYYMANATGRLLGTGLSGLAYQWGGVEACLMVASGFLALSAVADNRLNRGSVWARCKAFTIHSIKTSCNDLSGAN